MNPIAERIAQLRTTVDQAVRATGRDPQSVVLVLVTKGVDVENIRRAYEAGERDFGENRVQELVEKQARLPTDIRWHMIGHLQTNKVKHVVGDVAMIHSLDSLRLARALNERAKAVSARIPALIQCNVSGDTAKFGIDPDEIYDFVGACHDLDHMDIRGLMAIGPFSDDREFVCRIFRGLRKIQEDLKSEFPRLPLTELSMGMSQDYPSAIQEGATMLRIGTAVFGERGRRQPVRERADL